MIFDISHLQDRNSVSHSFATDYGAEAGEFYSIQMTVFVLIGLIEERSKNLNN